jgi:hypothetical protein
LLALLILISYFSLLKISNHVSRERSSFVTAGLTIALKNEMVRIMRNVDAVAHA